MLLINTIYLPMFYYIVLNVTLSLILLLNTDGEIISMKNLTSTVNLACNFVIFYTFYCILMQSASQIFHLQCANHQCPTTQTFLLVIRKVKTVNFLFSLKHTLLHLPSEMHV